MRRRVLRIVSMFVVLTLAGIQVVRPERTNPATPASADVAAQLAVPAQVEAVFARACSDCHSNRTRWPWYSNVAPVSWFVIDHVNHGRSHLNLSEWAKYDTERRDTLLTHICKLTRQGEMPMRSYLLMHRDARLSPADVEALCTWSTAARGSGEQRPDHALSR